MGGAVSSGRDNNELIDNLMGGNYIRTRDVEKVFRALDRADYMTPEARDQAYKDLAWRNGPLHMSAPCIYSEVMEGLELKRGLSFLNIGSGTGYLSTLVGLIIGSSGISHGVEVHPLVTEYAIKKLSQFWENSPTLDEFDFCEPKFYHGNGLCLAPLQAPYDRVYCGAGCPEEYQNYFQQLIKVGGILVMPLNDNLLQVKRTGPTEWSTRSLLNVSFATLRVPSKEEAQDLIRLEEQSPARLQVLARSVIRTCMRGALRRRHPQLREPPPRAPPAKKACPRRICIPVDTDSDAEGLNALHDLDRASGANEMNALLSLVLSMGHNRVAGALRVDPLDSPTDSSSEDHGDDDHDDDNGDDGGSDRPDDDGDATPNTGANRGSAGGAQGENIVPSIRTPVPRSVIMFEIRDHTNATTTASDSSTRDLPDTPTTSATPAGNATPATPTTPTTPTTPSTPSAPSTPADGLDKDTESPKDDNTTSKSKVSTSSNKDSTLRDKQSTSKDSWKSKNSSPRDKPIKKSRVHAEARRRGAKGSRRTSKENKDCGEQENPEVPAEVEIYLGKSREAPGTSTMEWEAADAKADTSDEETTETSTSKTKEDKRQKLDSGIGEENTPSAGTSSHTSKSEESDDERRSDSDEGCGGDRKGRSRRQKRGHLSTRSSSSTDDEAGGAGSAGGAAAGGRRRRRVRDSDDARRVNLSILMKRGVKELPLPHALKKYVNLGRCFEF